MLKYTPLCPRSPWAFVCVLCVLCGQARAQLPQPKLDLVFPLGAEAGSQVVLDLTGRDLDDAKALHFDHPGFKAELVKPNQFKVTIARDTPAGTYELRAVGKYGISGSRLLAVGHGLTEVRDEGSHDAPDKAQAVPMNAAVNGLSKPNAAHFFRFPAKKGERVTIDCQALRLDSLLRPALTLFAADGRELVRGKPYYGRTDPFIDWVAPADGLYTIGIHDVTYNGDLPYRLVISNRPQVEVAYPPVVVPGETVQLQIEGRNLPGGRPTADAVAGQPPLDLLLASFTAPKSLLGVLRFEHLQSVASPSLNARGFQARPAALANALNPLTFAFAAAPVTREREPNDTAGTAQTVSLPTVICGRFDKPGDVDWYSFTAKAGEVLAVDLLCERLELQGDPFVILTNEKGEELATFDDHGNTADALTQLNRDPVGTFTAPADGTYHLCVRERYRQGGPRFAYALRVGRAEPDFYPVVYHETPNDPTCPVLRRGGSALYDFCLNRRDGFDGSVTIEAEGLPRGVTCAPIHVSPQTELASVVFAAAADAPEWAGAIRLKAWAVIGGRQVERPVACVQRRWGEGNGNGASRACREVCLAVRGQAPYGLKVPGEKVQVTAGTAVETKVAVVRHWSDFKDRIQISGWKLPPGFDVAAAEIPVGKGEVPVKITVPAEVPPGSYSVILRGEAQVPFQPDPNVKEKPNVRVADPAPPLLVTVMAPVKK
jgi:hypothetical protein